MYAKTSYGTAFYCRSLYVRSDGLLYVQCGHDSVSADIKHSVGEVIDLSCATNHHIIGTVHSALKCGILMSDWKII